jgi:hypothetical protein
MDKELFLKKLDQAWQSLDAACAGLSDAQLAEPGVTGNWSVKDSLAHVTTWETEALKYLPLILAGGTPPRYAAQYGGIDAFNAQVTQQKKGLSIAEVRDQLNDTHRRLRHFVQGAPDEQFTQETRFRHRLRLETYSHYTLHAGLIRDWRQRSGL